MPGRTHWQLIVSMVIVVIVAVMLTNGMTIERKSAIAEKGVSFVWQPPDTSQLSFADDDGLVQYGRDLIARTSYYLGPKGRIAAISNGMNCQNCHLDAGARKWGNNYGAVFSTYPRFRERSGSVENIFKRVNDCIERSLNGRALDTNSREMHAIYSYMKWLGQEVPKGLSPAGSGIWAVSFLNRPADPGKGREVFVQHCQRCHGKNGEGLFNEDSTMYTYPPLWGSNSYTTAAGLYRLSRFAGYVKENMPFDAPQNARYLTDEEAWDVAAFVNSQPRPRKDFPEDWPDISGKPFDYPFMPYADEFSVYQHKYGPFGPIKETRERLRHQKKNH